MEPLCGMRDATSGQPAERDLPSVHSDFISAVAHRKSIHSDSLAAPLHYPLFHILSRAPVASARLRGHLRRDLIRLLRVPCRLAFVCSCSSHDDAARLHGGGAGGRAPAATPSISAPDVCPRLFAAWRPSRI